MSATLPMERMNAEPVIRFQIAKIVDILSLRRLRGASISGLFKVSKETISGVVPAKAGTHTA
jgi:hypothetical protein